MSRSRMFEWYKRFYCGREDVEVDSKRGDHQQAEPVKILKISSLGQKKFAVIVALLF